MVNYELSLRDGVALFIVMEDLLRSLIREALLENQQQAEKAYVKKGLLSQQDVTRIVVITGGDGFTKFLCALMASNGTMDSDFSYGQAHYELTNYNKNLFPIIGMENLNNAEGHEAQSLYMALKERRDVISMYRQLPSVAIRNMKDEVRMPRNSSMFGHFHHILRQFLRYLSLLDNRTEEKRQKVYGKMFSSKNRTIDDWLDFMEEFQNYAEPFSSLKDLYSIIKQENCEIVQDIESVVVVAVYDQEAIKALGCNSIWCFAYPRSQDHWWDYTTNDMLYYIFNKKNLYDQYVLTTPTDLYDVSNSMVPPNDVDDRLASLGVDRSVLTFQPLE